MVQKKLMRNPKLTNRPIWNYSHEESCVPRINLLHYRNFIYIYVYINLTTHSHCGVVNETCTISAENEDYVGDS